MLEETNNEEATTTIQVRVSTKQLVDTYKEKNMKHGSRHSYDDAVRFLLSMAQDTTEHNKDVLTRYKLAHQWIKSGDTSTFLHHLERMMWAYLDDPVNEFPDKPEVVESVRKSLEYLKKHSDVL